MPSDWSCHATSWHNSRLIKIRTLCPKSERLWTLNCGPDQNVDSVCFLLLSFFFVVICQGIAYCTTMMLQLHIVITALWLLSITPSPRLILFVPVCFQWLGRILVAEFWVILSNLMLWWWILRRIHRKMHEVVMMHSSQTGTGPLWVHFGQIWWLSQCCHPSLLEI